MLNGGQCENPKKKKKEKKKKKSIKAKSYICLENNVFKT